MKKICLTISEQCSNYIELLWYETSGLKDLHCAICQLQDVSFEDRDFYLEKYNKSYRKWRKASDLVIHEVYDGKYEQFEFDFINNTVTLEVLDE